MPERDVPSKFLVAFSLAGEQREFVRAIAEAVEGRLGRGTVFLDEWFEHYLAGEDADLKLQDIYGQRCDLAVVCVSERYGSKPWTQAEHRSIRARFMKCSGAADECERNSVIPIRVGDGEVEGILFNAIIPDVRKRSASESAELIIERLRLLSSPRAQRSSVAAEPPQSSVHAPNALGEAFAQLALLRARSASAQELEQARSAVLTAEGAYKEQVRRLEGGGRPPREDPPLFVLLRDLFDRKWSFWPDWAFAIAILQNTLLLTRAEAGSANVELKIDLRDQRFGIYNNEGKKFLARQLDAVTKSSASAQISTEVMQFLRDRMALSYQVDCSRLPLRWASGGVLPIVRREGKEWVALFYRDIPPIGLNIANGASESEVEQHDLRQIVSREFGEELLVLETHLMRPTHIPYDLDHEQDTRRVLRFAENHLRLRREHDDRHISPAVPDSKRIKINLVSTPFSVKIKAGDDAEPLDERVRNVLFSINPGELGLEVVEMFRMVVPDRAWLLDGEILVRHGEEYLARRPVILLDAKKLRSVYGERRSLGELRSDDPKSSECKLVDVPFMRDEFRIFQDDLDLRGERIAKLSASHERHQHQAELEALLKWRSEHAAMFDSARHDGVLEPVRHRRLLTLCPVTWKSLELAFEYTDLGAT